MSDLERCFSCDEPTGRAGISDDSIYISTHYVDLGPFCLSCFNDVCRMVDDDRGYSTEIARLKEEIELSASVPPPASPGNWEMSDLTAEERIAELEAELAATRIENNLMAAHQGIDNYQRCLDRITELEAENARLRRDCKVAEMALAEAGRRFAADDTEGVRLLLCDTNARATAAALASKPSDERVTLEMREQLNESLALAERVGRSNAERRERLGLDAPAERAAAEADAATREDEEEKA